MTLRNAIICLGSNLPEDNEILRCATLDRALTLLSGSDLQLVARSRYFRTPAFPLGSGPDFANAAAVFRSALDPESLLERCHSVEERLGRVRQERWGARRIDIDLVAVDGIVLPDIAVQRNWMTLSPRDQMHHAPQELILPHPRLQDRGFVLAPLCDVAPDWVHPVTQRSARQMHDALDAAAFAGIEPITERGSR
ncbi:2-amino-4-hydroxy-6-hydroxymethyldihydropteridine diphosphokinase [Palleronia aestuarii]|uniref:2-amino-4-hydroxy-6-hydroxymethyldihydropteridine pyrophosphokinase n=1 Tax=Palleronia aestuarii TaxID=568105 RepID=A0A2W7NR70_9RHOB|nr:2-amino-4-hydroxy-6-hydroxymethyldihydropteridine diphosphokinase [Palleronia aestuarii]